MGYVRKPKVYRLVFDDPDFEGLEIRMRSSVTTGQYLDIEELISSGQRDRAAVERMFSVFADMLVDWNLEDDDGNPVPADLMALYSLDLGFVMSIIEAWTEVMVGVPAPLSNSSTGGDPLEEASIPMETLSGSRAS